MKTRWLLLMPVVIAALVGGCGDDGPNNDRAQGDATDAPSTKAPEVTNTPGPTDTPKPPATSTPRPTATSAKLPRVGETSESKGSKYTVNEVRDPWLPNDGFSKPKAGNRYIAIDVTQEGVTAGDPYNPNYFFIQDSKDYVYEYTYSSPTPRFGSGNLQPGERVRGWMSFEVPLDATILVVQAQPEVLGGKIVIADLR